MKPSEFMTKDPQGKTLWVELREADEGPNPWEVRIMKIYHPLEGFKQAQRCTFPSYDAALETFVGWFKLFVCEEDDEVTPISLG